MWRDSFICVGCVRCQAYFWGWKYRHLNWHIQCQPLIGALRDELQKFWLQWLTWLFCPSPARDCHIPEWCQQEEMCPLTSTSQSTRSLLQLWVKMGLSTILRVKWSREDGTWVAYCRPRIIISGRELAVAMAPCPPRWQWCGLPLKDTVPPPALVQCLSPLAFAFTQPLQQAKPGLAENAFPPSAGQDPRVARTAAPLAWGKASPSSATHSHRRFQARV